MIGHTQKNHVFCPIQAKDIPTLSHLEDVFNILFWLRKLIDKSSLLVHKALKIFTINLGHTHKEKHTSMSDF